MHLIWILITLTIKNRGDLWKTLQFLWENRDVIAGGGVVILTGTAAGARFIRLRKVGDKLLRTRERVRTYRQGVQAEKQERHRREAITLTPGIKSHRRIGPPPNKRYSAAKEKTMLQKAGLGLALLVLAPIALISSYLFQQVSVMIDLYLLKNGANILVGLAFWALGIAVVALYLRVREVDSRLRDLTTLVYHPDHETSHDDHDTDDHGEKEEHDEDSISFMPPFGAR